MEENKIVNGYNKNDEDRSCGLGELLGRICSFICRSIAKGNVNYLMITKDSRKPIKLSLTLCVILGVVAFIPMIILTVVGLFTDHKFSIVGPDIKNDDFNQAFGKASDSARNMKNDFHNGYRNN